MKRIHYAWIVCLVSTLLLFVTMGTVSNGFSVFLPYIQEARGLTHAQTSSLVTLRCLVSFFAMLGIGWYYKRFSLRVGTGLAAAFAGLSFLLYSLARSYGAFCIGAAVSGLGYGLGSMIPVSVLMNRWFDRHRALALSICGTGSGIATILLPPVTTRLVERFSLAGAFRMEAAGVFVITAVIFLFLRSSPAEKGLAPCGHGEAAVREEHSGASYTLNARTWLLMGCVSLFMGALANPGFSHLSVLYRTEGFTAGAVAAILSGAGVVMTLGKLMFGETTDRLGGRRSTLLFGAVLLLGHILCCLAFTRSMAVSALTVLCLGMGYPIATIGPSVWANDLSSPDRYPTVIRRLQVIYAGGALAFAGIPGILADRFGSYIPAYGVMSGMMALALCFIALSYREARRRGHG